MIRLEVADGSDAGRVVSTGDDIVRIGRAPTSHLALTEFHVSTEHAQIVFTGDAHVLRDLQSTNGTRVLRGDTVVDLTQQPGRELAIESGDVLLLGDTEKPVRVLVQLGDDDDARIVSLRSLGEMPRVEAELGENRELLQGLYAAQKRIADAIDLDAVIDAVAAEVFRFLTRATHVTVALREDDEDGGSRAVRYVPVGSRRRGVGGTVDASTEPIPITRSVFKKVVAQRAAVLAADAPRDVGETASILGAHIVSTIGVPLWQGDQIVGVLQVDNRSPDGERSKGLFKERDLDLLALLGQSTSAAFVHARLVQRLRVAEDKARKENSYLKRREEKRREGGIIGESAAMQRVFAQLRKVVDTRVTVMIEGETGTGKELVASAVHYSSQRREKLFVAQNCAALPENLLESELFGHKKGAFTGATDDKKGLFELADGGTLFLDEVGEMPLALQAKLLRVLQEGEVRAVGSNTTKKVDVRVVAATNRDLEKEVAEGRFREDLFYRLRVFPLRIPPLRERREDVPLLAGHFLQKYAQEFGKQTAGFGQQAMELLQGYAWPGNVRELENEVQRLVIQLDPGEFVLPEHLSPRLRKAENVLVRVHPTKGTLREMMDEVEKWMLLKALEEHGNNKSATAKTLGITREGLHKKLKSLGIG